MSIWSDPWLLTLLFIGALQQHPLEQIVNVQWGDGLAVHFYEGAT